MNVLSTAWVNWTMTPLGVAKALCGCFLLCHTEGKDLLLLLYQGHVEYPLLLWVLMTTGLWVDMGGQCGVAGGATALPSLFWHVTLGISVIKKKRQMITDLWWKWLGLMYSVEQCEVISRILKPHWELLLEFFFIGCFLFICRVHLGSPEEWRGEGTVEEEEGERKEDFWLN